MEAHQGDLNRSLLEAKDLPTIPATIKLDGYYSLSDDDEDEDADSRGRSELVKYSRTFLGYGSFFF